MSDEKDEQTQERHFCPQCQVELADWQWACHLCNPEAYGEQYRVQAKEEE